MPAMVVVGNCAGDGLLLGKTLVGAGVAVCAGRAEYADAAVGVDSTADLTVTDTTVESTDAPAPSVT